MDKTAAKKPANAQASTTKGKGDKVDSKKERQMKEQNKKLKNKNEQEKRMMEEKNKLYMKARYDYKDPYQLSEGEIMIVIEHSDDPGRVLMSTSHDYDKYKRISSKIRQWIMRDFPSMKVIIKPNNHQSDNMRIGCFEISYFHMKEGKLERQDIFSKMVERKWPKWKAVQEKIKNYVKNSNLIVKIKDISKENKKQFEGMVIHIKNVLFAKTSTSSGATTKSLMGSDLVTSQNLQASQTLGNSQMGKSTLARSQQVAPLAESTLTKFKDQAADSTGVLKFEHLPVGNYAIVFIGDRTYKPVNHVSATEPEITIEIEVDLVEEGFFVMEVDVVDIQNKKSDLNDESNSGNANKTRKDAIVDEIKQLDSHEKKIGNYKISLIPSDDKRSKDSACIPITCEKSTQNGSPNPVYEAVIEPGLYDIILTNGTDQKVLKSKANLTRGENKMALISGKNNELMEDAAFKKYAKDRDAKRAKEEDSHHDHPAKAPATTVSGNAGQPATTGTKAALARPDTTSSMVSDIEESHNRLGSADIRNRPGSASALGRTQDVSHANVVAKEQVIAEDPDENDEDRFMVKIVAENGAVPFEMSFLFDDDEGITQMLSRDQAPTSGGYFMADNQREILCLDDARQREGYYRMIITRRPEVTSFSPVHVMINCNGISSVKKYTSDPFTRADQFLDYAVFKFPDNVYLPINVITTEKIVSPTYMLSQIRSLISKLSESKLGIDKIFGFSGKTERIEGEECLNIKEVQKSLENFMIPASEHILQAFKLHADKPHISLKRLTEAVENWRRHVSVLDEINDDEGEEEDNGQDDDYEDYGDFDNDHQN